MTDPLSLTAGIIALGSAVKAIIKGLERINDLKNAPSWVLLVSEEIGELNNLLEVAQQTIGSETTDNQSACRLLHTLEKVAEVIRELQQFIRFDLLRNPESFDNETEQMEIRWHVWLRKESKIREMAGILSSSRQKIAATLTAMTTISVMELPRLNVNLQHAMLSNQLLLDSFRSFEANVTQRLDKLQRNALMGQKSSEAHDLQKTLLDVPPTLTDGGPCKKSTVGACSPLIRSCSCLCHSVVAIRTPQWLGSSFGSLSVIYNRTAAQSCKPCNRRSCANTGDTIFKTQIYFPSWLLHRMMSVQFCWNSMGGHTFLLRTPRGISSKSNVFMLAQHGNIRGMQRLFEQRLASPFDVSLDEGRSALHYAVTATQPKMVAFLLAQGADPLLEDHNMLSAHDVVWNYLLQMPGSAKLELLQLSAGLSFQDTASLAKRNFTSLHQIVLGLSTLDLASYLDTTTSDLDQKDSLGKTPLCWAASRPNTETVKLLLEYGASPCLGDNRQQTPLHYCAGSGTAQSMALVLKAALEEAKQQASEWNRNNSQEEDNDRPEFFSEIIDARDSKGRTPLHFTTRMNFPEHTRLLLSFGADTECVDAVLDRTTLLCAIYWNSHEVISILLESGARTDVLDSRRASLLHYAARFGDIETLACLCKAKIGQLDVDARDDSGYTAWEIFESRHERCITDLEDVRTDSVKAFNKFKAHVTGQTSNPAAFYIDSEINI